MYLKLGRVEYHSDWILHEFLAVCRHKGSRSRREVRWRKAQIREKGSTKLEPTVLNVMQECEEPQEESSRCVCCWVLLGAYLDTTLASYASVPSQLLLAIRLP